MNWKATTLLSNLPPDREIEIPVAGRLPIRATPRYLINVGRFGGSLSLEQLERAFANRPYSS